MAKTIIFDKNRVRKQISIPRLKDICPKETSYYSDGTFYIIYKNDDKTYPNVGEIDEDFSYLYHKHMIKCYISREDTLSIIENILFRNPDNIESFALLTEELSKLHNTENKVIAEIKIEYDKIEKLYEKYKDVLIYACDLYKFCYYWPSLCIALDFRVADGSPTVIHRSMIVRDAIAYIRGQISRDEFGKSWDAVRDRVDPTKMITDIKWVPVKTYEKELKSDRFINKKGEKVPVEAHGRLKVTTD